MPFFTIVTVTKSNLAGLKKTHASLTGQSSKDFEWIVIDGASTDGTLEYLKTTNADWISEKDSGIYEAMNKAIERVKGAYILFLNAGDVLATTDILEKIKTAAKDNPDFIYGDSLEGGEYKPAREASITAGMFTHHQSMFYNRKTLGDMRYNTQYKIAADYDLTARFLREHTNHLYCPIPICNFESGGVSQTNASLGRREQYKVRKNLKLTGTPQNIIITGAQSMLWALRSIAPSLYWHLKSSGNSAPANAQNEYPPDHPKNPA